MPNPATSEGTLPKLKIVVKRKRISKPAKRTRIAKRGGGLPSLLKPSALAQAAAAAAAVDEQAIAVPPDEFSNTFLAEEDEIPCDTLMVIRGLQQQERGSLPIPLVHFTGTPFLHAVLECQVRKRLSQQAAVRELQDLLDDLELVRLRPADAAESSSSTEGLSVLLTREDYFAGVKDACAKAVVNDRDQQQQNGFKADHYRCVIVWFLRHWKEWKGRNIRQEVLQAVVAQNPILVPISPEPEQLSFEQILHLLQNMQIILPNHHQSTYQLWLPEWGTVLKAWQKAQTTLVANLKRSYHGERSIKALNQPHSPIPTNILIEWLTTQGIVDAVERPSGTFLRRTD